MAESQTDSSLINSGISVSNARVIPKPDSNHLQGSIRFIHLSNGLTFALLPDHTVPLATVFLVLKPDSADGAERLLFSKLVLKHNRLLGQADDVNAQIKTLGLQWQSGSSPDYAILQFTVQSGMLEQGLAFLHQVASEPIFDSLQVLRTLRELATQAQQEQTDPRYYLKEDMGALLWKGAWPRHRSAIDYAALSHLTASQLTTWHSHRLKPENLLLVIGGDIDSGKVIPVADSLFLNWPLADSVTHFRRVFANDSLTKDTTFITVNERSRQSFVQLAWRLPIAGLWQYPALLLTQLFNDKILPLNRRLANAQLADPPQLSLQIYPDGATFTLSLMPKPEKTIPCVEMVLDELKLLDDSNYISPAMLTTAKLSLERDRIYTTEQTNERCMLITRQWALGLQQDYLQEADSVQATTLSDLHAFATNYLMKTPVVMGFLLRSNQPDYDRVATWVDERNRPQAETDRLQARFDSLMNAEQPLSRQIVIDSLLYRPDTALAPFTLSFRLNQAELDPSARLRLGALIRYLRQHPKEVIYINGHTDHLGKQRYNLKLSLDRARLVANYLTKHGHIAADRLHIRGYGKRRPLYDEKTYPDLGARNRRVEFSHE